MLLHKMHDRKRAIDIQGSSLYRNTNLVHHAFFGCKNNRLLNRILIVSHGRRVREKDYISEMT